jgi:hypothetical protein
VIAAAEAEAQAWLSIWTATNAARSLLDAALLAGSNSNCMSYLEAQTGKSASQLMQDANTDSFVDVTGAGGSLTIGQLGYPGQSYSSETAAEYFGTRTGAIASTLSPGAGSGLVFLGSSYFNSNFGLGGPTVPTTNGYKESVLFHEFFHTEGVNDTDETSVAFNNWIQGGCKGAPPGN